MDSVKLKLFVAGPSTSTVTSLRQLLSAPEFPEAEVEVVDILENPHEAESARVLATPCIVRVSPRPQRRIVGSLSAEQLAALLDSRTPQTDKPGDPTIARSKTDESQGQFLDRMGHEMGNSVAVIRGFASTLLDQMEVLDKAAIAKGVEAIVRSATSLQVLIDSVRIGHVVEAGDVKLELVDVDLGDYVIQAVRDLETLTKPHPVTVATEDGLVTRIDVVRIRQVISNLLSNAAKFSSPTAPISVSVTERDGWATVAIRDAGRGILPDRQGELFKRYSRLGAAERGTGLGLFVSRGLARAHGGDLTVESDGRSGSTFTLTLPLERAS